MNLKLAMCEALVDGWHGDWNMGRVISQAWRLCDKEPENETKKYTDAAIAVGSKYLYGADRAQVWIAKNMRNLNDALWASRKRDTCIAIAKKSLGMHPGRQMQINVRARDVRHDWNTVK